MSVNYNEKVSLKLQLQLHKAELDNVLQLDRCRWCIYFFHDKMADDYRSWRVIKNATAEYVETQTKAYSHV